MENLLTDLEVTQKKAYSKFGGKWLKDIKNERLKINQLYWTDGDTTFVSFEDLDDSKFRMVSGEYAERNLEILKSKYDVDKELTSEEIALISMEFSLRLKDYFGERPRSNAKMQIDTLRF